MPGSNYLVARSLDRATDESSSARRVSSNGSFAARLTTHPTDDPLLVARPTLPMSWTPASLLSRWKRFQSLSRRPFFARLHATRPFKSRRTFDSFWQLIVRDSPARHLRTPAVHLALTLRHEQSAPFPPPQPTLPSETVKICQDRARSDSHQILSQQHPHPAPHVQVLNPPPVSHPATGLNSIPATLPVHFHQRTPPPACLKFRTAGLISPA